MRAHSTLALVVVAACTSRPTPQVVPGPSPRVEVQRLAPGVFALKRLEPLALAGNSNSLVVVGDEGVTVVDAQFTREATLEHLAAIRGVTRLPVKWVVNTHWHDDHFAGNQVYADSFPGVQFVIHANTRADLEAQGKPNRTATWTGVQPTLERYERLFALGLGPDSAPLGDAGRASMSSAFRVMRQYLAEKDGFREATAGPSVQQRLTIGRGDNVIEVRWLGRANTRGDLVVHLPRRSIIATGDLLVHPVPFAFASHPGEWLEALDAIAAWQPRVVLPGHGPVMRDLGYLRQVRAMLADARDTARAGAERGDSLARLVRTVRLAAHRHAVTGGEQWHEYMFDQFFLQPTLRAAWAEAHASRASLARGTTAITNVNVIPMTLPGPGLAPDTVLRGVTVLVRDGRIAAVGRDVEVPAGATRVDGAGKWLVPGLADMHTHLYSDESLPDSLAPAELGVILANGVTAARLMIGTPEQLALKQRVARGEVAGPQLWIASPQLTGRVATNAIVVTTPEEARAAVSRVADAGYDQVKLTLWITRPVYDAIADEAAKRRIRVVGHVEPEVGVARALEARQQLEHLDAYFEAVLADSAPMKTSLTQQRVFAPANWASADYWSDAKIAAIAGATARAGAWSSPTLNVFNRAFAAREEDDVIRSRPDWRLMPKATRDLYLRARERYWAPATVEAGRTEARRRRYVQVRNALVKAIADSGGRIFAGSDTPEWFHAYGFGLHRELQAYVEAGLTPWRALETATRNPAEFLGQLGEWGTIEPGKRADLLLLAASPLDDIRNTERIEAVLAGGRLFTRSELDAMIEAGVRAVGGDAAAR